MTTFAEVTTTAFERFQDIVEEEHEFPDLAGHIYLERLLQEHPLVFRRVVLSHGLIGMVYTPVIAEAIPFSHLWSPRYLVPENKALVLKDEELLGGHAPRELGQRKVREELQERVRQAVLDYMHKRYQYYLRFSDFHKPVSRSRTSSVLPRCLIVLSDHERILGIGDQGKSGSKICSGKLNCYFLGNGMFPGYALPLGIDVGTDNEAKLQDPAYDGMRHPRLKDDEYYPLMHAVLDALAGMRPGLLQFEDFGGERAWETLRWFRKHHPKVPCFNDDIEGTGAVVVSALMAANRTVPGLKKRRVLFHGAGGAALGIAQQAAHFMGSASWSRMIFTDSAGVLYEGRTVKTKRGQREFMPFQQKMRISPEQAEELKAEGWKPGDRIPMEAAARTGTSVMIGTSTLPGQFTPELLSAVQQGLRERGENDSLLVFSLSNPTSVTECISAEDGKAYIQADAKGKFAVLRSAVQRLLAATQGRMFLATGSPFPPVEWKARHVEVGQCNNFFVFPGVALAIDLLKGKAKLDMGKVLHAASEGVAALVPDAALASGRLCPEESQLERVTVNVASEILRATRGRSSLRTVETSRWTARQQPAKGVYSHRIVERAADFDLDDIREGLRAYRKASG